MIENDIEEQDAKKPQDIADSQRASTEDESSRADRHFRTDHLMADIKGRSVRGGAVTMAAQGANFVLQFGSTAILARLLTPADFGLIAMVTAVVGFVAMFNDAGLSMATVQREHITHAQVSTLFWINVALSAAVMLVVAALAPVIAWFYGEPRLTAITLALAATFIFGGLTVQHQALLQRQMRFMALSIINIATFAASVTAALLAAWQGLGYWSLVIMSATAAAVNAALVWACSGWRPSLPVRGSGVMPMLKFGGGITGFNFANYFARNADNVLIGWWWGAGALGIYSKAYGLLMMPLRQISTPLMTTAIPALSRLHNDPLRYRRGYVSVLQMVCFLTMPVVAILIGSSDLVILAVLGPQWVAATPIFNWLGIAGLLQPANITLGILLNTQGRTSDYFRVGLINAIATIVVFVISMPFGILAVAASYTVFSLVVTPLLWLWAGRKGPVSAGLIATTVFFPLTLSIVGLLTIVLMRKYVLESSPLDYVLVPISGLVPMAMLLVATRKGRAISVEMFRFVSTSFTARKSDGPSHKHTTT